MKKEAFQLKCEKINGQFSKMKKKRKLFISFRLRINIKRTIVSHTFVIEHIPQKGLHRFNDASSLR